MFESFQFVIIFFLSNLGPFLASSICECQHSKQWRQKFCAWNWHQGQNYGSVGRSLKTSMILDRKEIYNFRNKQFFFRCGNFYCISVFMAVSVYCRSTVGKLLADSIPTVNQQTSTGALLHT